MRHRKTTYALGLLGLAMLLGGGYAYASQDSNKPGNTRTAQAVARLSVLQSNRQLLDWLDTILETPGNDLAIRPELFALAAELKALPSDGKLSQAHVARAHALALKAFPD